MFLPFCSKIWPKMNNFSWKKSFSSGVVWFQSKKRSSKDIVQIFSMHTALSLQSKKKLFKLLLKCKNASHSKVLISSVLQILRVNSKHFSARLHFVLDVLKLKLISRLADNSELYLKVGPTLYGGICYAKNP